VDISDRKRMEDALREADKRKDDFLAILAHELRNPLAPISNAMPILQSQETSKEMRFKAMDIVVRQVNQMVRLVDDLMDVSRIRGGKIELRKERIKLRDAIHTAVETSRPVIEQHNHTLTIELPESFVYANADLLRLSQVIGNLLNNAAKYTKSGGHIWLTLEQAGNEGLIRVRDNGIGIPQHMLPRIFDMFTQVDDSLDRAQGGIGIGLMLVKNLIEMHGGSVEVSSEGPGKGSEFTLRLPVLTDMQENVKKESVANKNQYARQMPAMRILLVEDYKVLAQMTSWALELEGHEVRVAQDGPSAIELAKTYVPDLVLMDIGLPGMSGYELCEAMRKEPVLNRTLFIAQTGWGQEEHRQRSKEAGFHYHMLKPIDTQALQKLIYSLNESPEILSRAVNA
jgi:CheY-like chemotaxis protein/two-component sensor histidine kinase